MRPPVLSDFTWVLLCVPVLLSAGQRITVEAGQDSVTLPCGARKETEIIVVEWSRPDLDPDVVLVLRDDQLYLDDQHPSFMNRVDLQDRQVKDGDASLILKNVKINDAGTYQCTVIQEEGNRRKRAAPETSIHLVVSPPGTQEEGGEGASVGDEEGGPAGRGHLGLVLGLVSVLWIVVIAVAVSAAVWILKRPVKKTPPPDEEATARRLVQTQSSDNSPPPEGATVQPLV